MGNPQKPYEIRYCEICGEPIERWSSPKGAREALTVYAKRRFCGKVCQGKAQGASSKSRHDRDGLKDRIADLRAMLRQFRKVDPNSIYVQEAEHRLKALRA